MMEMMQHMMGGSMMGGAHGGRRFQEVNELLRTAYRDHPVCGMAQCTEVRQATLGNCPTCGMALEPITSGPPAAGTEYVCPQGARGGMAFVRHCGPFYPALFPFKKRSLNRRIRRLAC